MVEASVRSQRRSAALLAWLAAAWSACAPSPVPPAFQDDAVPEGEYRIAPADRLVVRVWKQPELSVECPVLPDGAITVPLAGTISATGLTTAELEDAISARLSEYVTAPAVSVIVQEVNSKRVSVIGEVNRNGMQTVAVDARIMDALSQAGGFTNFANRKKIKIIRRSSEGELEFRFDYDAYKAGRAPGTNVRLKPGDTIVVPD
jgi:polysaccharide export outer membrane protein